MRVKKLTIFNKISYFSTPWYVYFIRNLHHCINCASVRQPVGGLEVKNLNFSVWRFDLIPRHVLHLWVFADTFIGHSNRCTEICLTTCNIHKRQTSIRTRNPNNRSATDPRLRPRGHWNRRLFKIKVSVTFGMCLADRGVKLPQTVTFLFCIWRYPFRISGHVAAVGWGTALQAWRSRVWFPIVSLEFFIDVTLPATLWPWGRLSL
jgi:hypothetical protein